MLECNKKTQPKEINAGQVKGKLIKKYPKVISMVEGVMEFSRDHTENVKNKYLQYSTLKQYTSNAGFSEILICDQKGTTIEVQPLFNLIRIEEAYLPILEKIKNFAPVFYDKALKHTLGDRKEEISGHEMEHSKGFALKIYPREIKTAVKKQKAAIEDKTEKQIKEIKKLLRLKRKTEYYTESQRILKHSKGVDDVIESIAIIQVFSELLESGIEYGLTVKMNREYFINTLSEQIRIKEKLKNHKPEPIKVPVEIKGRYPYLKENTIHKIANKVESIRDDLKQKYEDKYGKIEIPVFSAKVPFF